MSDQAILSSFDGPVGILREYCFPETRSFTMSRSRSSLIGGNFDLKDDNDQLVLNVDTGIRKGKTFTDPAGTEVLHSGTTVWTRATTITLPNPGSEERGKEVGWVKSNISGKFKIGAKFIDFSGEERILGMKGDWKTNAPLVIDDEVVAYVKIAKIMSSTRSIQVAANVDIALVFAAAVLFDQMVNDTMGAIVV